MKAALSAVRSGSESLSYLLGGSVIALAVILAVWSIDPETVINWALKTLGPGFVVAIAALTLGVCYCLAKLVQSKGEEAEADFWLGAGVQLSNGVATLALTFTLFGISVGIGALSSQGLSPETVEGVIRDLTASFTLAFMTTVIGLPLSTALRALLIIFHGRQRLRAKKASKSDSRIGGKEDEILDL